MKFGGIQKNSLIDYPGKISCVLFLSGCNFQCPYCHNPELAKGCSECLSETDEQEAYAFLESRRGFLDGVVISGGEPTLCDKELMVLCENIKCMGYPIKLDTNGSRPAVIQELISRKLLDYLAMDVKTDPPDYSPFIQKECDVSGILASIKIIMESGLPYEFKTTCVKPLIDLNAIENICHLIQGARLYAIQQFQTTEVLNPGFFKNKDCRYTEDELRQFKSVADIWVERCIVR